jgi:hypothetical protein
MRKVRLSANEEGPTGAQRAARKSSPALKSAGDHRT